MSTPSLIESRGPQNEELTASTWTTLATVALPSGHKGGARFDWIVVIGDGIDEKFAQGRTLVVLANKGGTDTTDTDTTILQARTGGASPMAIGWQVVYAANVAQIQVNVAPGLPFVPTDLSILYWYTVGLFE